MPRAEEVPLTPQGQPYGEATQQQDYIASTAAPAQAANALPPLSPQREEQFTPPPLDKEIPNLHEGLNLDEILLGPTQRPLEPVTAGLSAAPKQKIADVLDALKGQVGSQDIAFLAAVARNAGL